MKNCKFLLLVAAIGAACAREADIDLIPQQARLVINGHFSDADSVQYVSITNSIPLGESPLELKNISDAVVEVYEDKRLLGQASYTPSSLSIPGIPDFRAYYKWSYPTVPGKEYEVRISAPGYPDARAKDRLPLNAPFFSTPRYIGFNADNSTIAIEVDLSDSDTARESWYHLLFFLRDKNRPEVRIPAQLVRPDNDNEVVSSDANGIILNFGANFGLLIDDKTFSNNSRTLLLTLEAAGIAFNPPGTFELQAEWRQISRAYYTYYVSVVKQLDLRDNAFAQPVLIFNNIQNGLGNFSGYRAARSEWISTR